MFWEFLVNKFVRTLFRVFVGHFWKKKHKSIALLFGAGNTCAKIDESGIEVFFFFLSSSLVAGAHTIKN